jgi:hypothetical protein
VFWIRPMTRSFTRGSAVVAAAFALFALAAAASGEIPKKINYQGKLTDLSGLPLSGSHSMVFSIYEAADGGSPLWSESKTAEADSSGVFSTVLGSVTPIEVDFTGPCWLEIEVDGETLSPRREVVSVPFAYQAEHADSAANAAEASNAIALGGRPAEAFADSSVDGHSLDAADGDPEDAVYVDDYGRVGLGTSSPATFLDVRTFGGAEGGVAPYGEVLGHFKISGSDAHSAISIDAQSGRDAILYFAQEGASMWDLRNDTDIGDKFQLRWHRGGTVKAVTVDTTGYVGVLTTTPNGPLHVQSTLSINSGTRLTDRVAPLVVGDGDGANPCILIDGNQIEQADTTDLVYINYNSPARVSLAQGGGNVGIGTTTPGAKLEVAGQVKISAGASGSGLLVASGYEGIGTSTPNGPLHVESTLNITSGTNLRDRRAPVVVGDGDGTGACVLIDGNQIEQADTNSTLYLNYSSPSKIAMAQGGGNVGIGTSSPDAKLEVAGQVKITGGSPGAGKVLTSNANGLATWEAITTDYYISPLKILIDDADPDFTLAADGAVMVVSSSTSAAGGFLVPIDIPGTLSGVRQKISSLTIYYKAGTGAGINAILLKKCNSDGSSTDVIYDDNFRNSHTWTSVTLTDASPEEIAGSLALRLYFQFQPDAEMYLGTIVVRTTD